MNPADMVFQIPVEKEINIIIREGKLQAFVHHWPFSAYLPWHQAGAVRVQVDGHPISQQLAQEVRTRNPDRKVSIHEIQGEHPLSHHPGEKRGT
jgi:hypothetical protein